MFAKSIKDFFRNPVITLPAVIIALISGFFTGILNNNNYLKQMSLEGKITKLEDISTEMAKFISLVLLLLIVYFFISPIITAITNIMIKNVVNEEKPHLNLSIKSFPVYYWRLFGIMILKLLIFVGLFVVFFISLLPFLINAGSNPNNFPAGLFLIFVIIIFAAVFLVITLIPVEILLIYDNIGIGESLSKGFKFGLKNFFKILGSCILIGIIASVFTLIFRNSGAFSIISSLITAYLGLFINVYIMNLYRNTKRKLEFETNPPAYESRENVKDDDNNFII